MSFQLHVQGQRACFRRPEFANDLVTYDVITPPAARGLFEAIHWTPSIRWEILQVDVLHPIRSKWQVSAAGDEACRTRRTQVLCDVSYLVTARFEITEKAHANESAGQHARMFARRARRRDFYREPFLGLTEFSAEVRLVESAEENPALTPLDVSMDLGWMVFDAPTPECRRFFRASLEHGTMKLPARDQDLPS